MDGEFMRYNMRLLILGVAIALQLMYPSEVYQGWILPAIMAGAGILSNIFGNKKKEQTATTNQTTTSNNQFSNTSNPVYDALAQQYRDSLIGDFMGANRKLNFQDPNALAQTLVTQRLQGLNRQSDLTRSNLNTNLAARGLGNSPMAAYAMTNFDNNRIMQGSNLLNQAPLLERQFQMENQNAQNQRDQLGLSLMNMIPYGTSQSGTSSGTQTTQGTTTQTQPGNMLGGLFGGLAQGIGFLGNSGVFPKTGTWSWPSASAQPYNPGYSLPSVRQSLPGYNSGQSIIGFNPVTGQPMWG